MFIRNQMSSVVSVFILILTAWLWVAPAFGQASETSPPPSPPPNPEPVEDDDKDVEPNLAIGVWLSELISWLESLCKKFHIR